MRHEPDPRTLERFSRLNLWLALALLALVGAWALITVVDPGLAGGGPAFWLPRLLPVFIVIAVAWSKTAATASGASSHALRALQQDEWRRQILDRACRDALVATLALQPVLVAVLAAWPVASEAAFMACATAIGGLATLLSSLLIRDR